VAADYGTTIILLSEIRRMINVEIARNTQQWAELYVYMNGWFRSVNQNVTQFNMAPVRPLYPAVYRQQQQAEAANINNRAN
jgi:hypothetical protein